MTCRLAYIDKLAIPNAEKVRLTEKHFAIGKALKAEGTPEDPLFVLKDGYLRFNTKLPGVYQEQIDAIEALNVRFGADPANPVIKRVDLDNATSFPIPIVAVDVRPLLKPGFANRLDPDALTEEDESILSGVGLDKLQDVAQSDLVTGLRDFSLRKNANDEFQYVDQQHHKLFTETIDSLRDKLERYLHLLEDKAVEHPDKSVKLSDLQDQLQQLSYPNALQQVEAMSAFIVQASGWLDAAYQNFFRETNSVVSTQHELETGLNRKTGNPLSTDERQRRINFVAKELSKSKHYLYLFDDLVKFQQNLSQLGFTPVLENKVERSPAFSQYLNSVLDSIGVTPGYKEMVNALVQSDEFTLEGLEDVLTGIFQVFHSGTAILETTRSIRELRKQLLDRFPAKTAEAVLQDSIRKSLNLRSALTDNHYRLVKNWIWPKIQSKQKGYTGQFKLEENDIIPLLKSATEEEGIFSYGLDAPIQSDDPITAIIANIVSDAIYDASLVTQSDVARLSSVRDKLGIDKTMTSAQVKQYHRQFTHDNLLLLEGKEGGVADADWEGPALTVSVFPGEPPVKLKAYTKRSYLEEYNTSLYQAHKQVFDKGLAAQVDTLWNLVPKNPDGTIRLDQDQLPDIRSGLLTFLKANTNNPYYARVLSSIFHKNQKGEYYLKKQDIDSADPDWLRLKIKKAFQQQFFAEHTQGLQHDKLTTLYSKHGLLRENGLTPDTTDMNPWIINNSSEYLVKGGQDKSQLAQSILHGWYNSLVHYTSGTHQYVYARKTDNTGNHSWGWVDLTNPGALDTVTRLYYAKNKLINPAQQYHVTQGGFGNDVQQQWNRLQSDDKALSYYHNLYNTYQDANENLGSSALKHGVLPQIDQQNNINITEEGGLKRLWNWILHHTFIAGFRQSWRWLTGAPEPKTTTGYATYLDNSPVKTIRPRFTTHISDDTIEQDLFRSTLMYKAGSNQYKALQSLNPQIHALRTIIQGDTSLGISARQANAETWTRRKLGELVELQQKKIATRRNKKILSFLDDIIYGDPAFSATFQLGNKTVDLAKLGQRLSGFTAFSSLAWNISAMAGNIGVGFLNNYSEAVKGKYYKPEDWTSAQREYWSNVKDLVADLTEPNPSNRSKLTQLAIRLDAIQGELLDENGEISREGNTQKMMDRALFWTQSGAEHWIQTVSMVAQMKGYVLDDGRRLWDTVRYIKGEPITFENVSDEELRKFQQQLHSVNKQLHGHYASIDKALIQRHWLGQLAMMFKKYIYSSLRYRFSGERFDWEAGDETEGHLRAYWEKLLVEVKSQQPLWRKVAVLGTRLTIKPTIGAIDQLTGGRLGKASPTLSNYIYGNEQEQRNAAARQTSFDVLWYLLMVITAGFVHGLDSDDDPNGVILKNIEAFTRRMEGDLGYYLPLYLGTGAKTAFSTYDKTWTMIKSPLAQLRAYDGTVSLLSQLIGVEHSENGWDFSFNDEYSRSGPGYEKGDLKITHKLEKSLFGPYYQMVRLMNPDSQLQYLNLSRRNSQ